MHIASKFHIMQLLLTLEKMPINRLIKVIVEA